MEFRRNLLSPSKRVEKAAGLFEELEGETNFVRSPLYIYILKKSICVKKASTSFFQFDYRIIFGPLNPFH